MSFKTLKEIRAFVKSHQGKTITPANPIVFEQFKKLLSSHPTWKSRLDEIAQLHIGVGFNKTNTVLKLKLHTSKRFLTISWRKCYAAKPRKPKNQLLQLQPPPSDNIVDVDVDGDSDGEINTNIPIHTNSHPNSTDQVSPHYINLFQSPPTVNNTVEQKVGADRPDEPNESNESKRAADPKLTSAMRYAVRMQITKWSHENRLLRRCRTCQAVTRLHVDHVHPFSFIQRDFFEQNSSIPKPSQFEYSRRTCQPKFKRQDIKFSRAWQYFHNARATFQWLCSKCNLKKGNRK